MRRFIILCCAALLTGCASRSYRFDGVGADGSTGREIRYVLESEAGNEGSITVQARGRAHARLDDRETDTLRVMFVLDNASDDSLEIPLEKVTLTDDEGRGWRRARVAGPFESEGEGPPQALLAPSHARTSYELLFDAGAPGSLKTTGSVTLGWSYRFRGQSTDHKSRFLPVRIERRGYWSGGVYFGAFPPFSRWGYSWGTPFGPGWCP